ncbi:hypothetical protein IJJ12_03500 [bacterium]|nr:hypothetical protein [bacterium]
MLTQMHAHEKKVAQVLRDFPTESEKWQWWCQFHEQQLSYFQANRLVYAVFLAVALLTMVIGLAMVGVGGEVSGWGVTLSVMGGTVSVALGIYMAIYTVQLHTLEEQWQLLFDKAINIQTKPTMTVLKFLLDLAGKFVSGKAAVPLEKLKAGNVWK